MKLTFPLADVPSLRLPPDFLNGWDNLNQKTQQLRERISGTGSLRDARKEAHEALAHTDDKRFEEAVRSSAATRRAIVALWSEDAELASRTMTAHRFRSVAGPDVKLSAMGIASLLALYLTHFTSLGSWNRQLPHLLREALRHHSSSLKTKALVSGPLATLRVEPDNLLSSDSPTRLASRAIRSDISIDALLENLRLGTYRSTEFGAEILVRYFLNRIEASDPTQNHEFLDELRTSEAVRALMPEDGRLLGHHAVEKLVEKARTRGTGDHWMGTILAIAGDPRMRHGETWNTWWSLIQKSAREFVIEWLGKRDLQLFLDAYERFVEDATRSDAQRMFEERKVFIEGLLKLDVIRETRVFAGHAFLAELSQMTSQEIVRTFSWLTGSTGETGDKAVIVIDCGDFQLVEASHNFKLWVYTGPRIEALFDRSQKGRKLDFFRNQAPRLAEPTSSHGTGSSVQSFPHQGKTWQVNALKFLHKRGITLPIQGLMSEESYNNYVSRHGQPTELL